MPADTNPAGDVFGGRLVWRMDLAAGIAAIAPLWPSRAWPSCSRCRSADEVNLYAKLVATGRTSMRAADEAWRRGRNVEDTTRGDGGRLHLRRPRR
jgi:acyl-CoA thioesterase YciA